MSRILAQAPSNIAIVKYMGKSDRSLNLPANPSISMTLSELKTWVDLRTINRLSGSGSAFVWIPGESVQGFASPQLSQPGIEKVLLHCERISLQMPDLLSRFGIRTEPLVGGIEIRSANTFPAAVGIASSASSFAALTLGVAAVFCGNQRENFEKVLASEGELRQELAKMSRVGSGSSCRSFEGPWVKWNHDQARAVSAQLEPLVDIVVLVGKSSKQVSSSEAHHRVETSPLWEGRVQRATDRVSALEYALDLADWKSLVALAWQELWEMHSLFHTARDSFTYWLPGSIEVLNALAPEVRRAACLVTMDAGPNVHVLVPQSLKSEWETRLRSLFPQYDLLIDQAGSGASLCSN